ncbi:MAG: LysR family transcriptional regulator [Pseudomonadales bacterium]|nr:LysR family transcriptional regulator [Pseudomonadales bacterium]
MDISKLSINSLIVFDAVYRTQNLSDVADILDSSQPAISRTLQKMRHTLNDPLFIRQDAKMTPTAKSKAMAIHVKNALDSLQYCVDSLSEFDPAKTKMHYRIGLNDLILTLYSQKIIQSTLSKAPELDLSFVNANYLDALSLIDKNMLDIAVISHYSVSSRYSHEVVFQDDYITIAREDHPKITDKLNLNNFTTLEHILVTYNNASNSWVDDELVKHNLARKIRVKIPFFANAPLLVSTSDLICTLPRQFANYYAKNLPIKQHALPLKNHTHTFFIVWQKRFDNDPAHKWFRGILKEVLIQSLQLKSGD